MTLITIVGVSVGADSYGTGAGQGVLRLTVRGEKEEELNTLKERIIALCREKAVNIRFAYKIFDPFPETKNHSYGVDKVKAAASDYLELPEPMRWSEDFGYYLKEAKGAFFGIGCGEEYSQLHTAEYDFPDSIIPVALDMFNKLAK